VAPASEIEREESRTDEGKSVKDSIHHKASRSKKKKKQHTDGSAHQRSSNQMMLPQVQS